MMKTRLLALFLFMTAQLVGAGAAQPEHPAILPGLSASAAACPSLPPPSGPTTLVASVNALQQAVDQASPGLTILVADGVYNLDGVYLRIEAPGVTLRSASGNRGAVVLDGNYLTTEIVQIVASNVTLADLTLREAYYHPVHVSAESGGSATGTVLYNLHVIDPGEQAIKINPYTASGAAAYPDNGLIACSHIELASAGRPHIRNNCYTGGIDAHAARGWTIRDNLIEGFWCAQGLSEHGIHLWRGSRDTLIERNLLRDNARGIGLGLVTTGPGRTFPDDPCPEVNGYVDHWGGVVRNNIVFAGAPGLFASASGFDCGVCLWNACRASALHNTVYTLDPAHTFSAIEWRFPNTQADIANNLANAPLRERDGAASSGGGNLANAQAGWFANPAGSDLHLRPAAGPAIDQALPLAGLADDFDGQPRPFGVAADIGADEYIVWPNRLFLPILSR